MLREATSFIAFRINYKGANFCSFSYLFIFFQASSSSDLFKSANLTAWKDISNLPLFSIALAQLLFQSLKCCVK